MTQSIVVTGGAGFIGSQIIKGLNQKGFTEIIVVDNLANGRKFLNLRELEFADYIHKTDFLELIKSKTLNIQGIFHQGACSSTTEWDGRYMMDNNFTYSKSMLELAITHSCPLIYASSAATYGGSATFKETAEYEKPINVYGYSKLLFDQYIRRLWATKQPVPQIVGLRYFNVYGPGETHKGSMSSVAYHFNNQLKSAGVCQLFEGTHGYGNGEQLRDFVYVEDIVNLNLWLFENQQVSGIFNAGTGACQSFNDVADAVIKWHGSGVKRYIPFPEHLTDAYQSYTQADLTLLREAGYTGAFRDVESGVRDYLNALNL